MKQNFTYIFNIFQLILYQYIESFVLNVQASHNEYNFIDIYREINHRN